MTSADHVPCAPFRELVRLKFAHPDDPKRVVQRGVREDDEALVHHASGGPYFLSFRGGDEKSDYIGKFDLKRFFTKLIFLDLLLIFYARRLFSVI